MRALSAVLTVCAGLAMANAAALNPVVLVPGLAGSQIRAKLSDSIEPHFWCKRTETDWFNLWLNVAEVLPEQKDCLMARVALTYNASTGRYSNATGVALDTNVDFGNVSGVASLDPSLPKETGYWLAMIEYLKSKFGYVPGLDLHGAPYDWRLAPDGHSAEGAYYDRLKALIETTVSRNGGKGVVIVSHSLGGPTILGFLALQTAAWKREHVASFVPISAPFAGGTCQALAFVQGDTLGVPFIPSDYLRPIQVTAASGPFVIATPEGFGSKVIVKTDTKNYTAADWPSFLRDLGHAQAAEIFDALHEKKLAVDTLPPPGVPTHVVYSHGTPTRSVFTYEGSFAPGYKKVAKKIENGDGDGTVNLESLLLPAAKWKDSVDTQLELFSVANVSHFSMVTDSRVLSYVEGVLKGLSAPAGEELEVKESTDEAKTCPSGTFECTWTGGVECCKKNDQFCIKSVGCTC